LIKEATTDKHGIGIIRHDLSHLLAGEEVEEEVVVGVAVA